MICMRLSLSISIVEDQSVRHALCQNFQDALEALFVQHPEAYTNFHFLAFADNMHKSKEGRACTSTLSLAAGCAFALAETCLEVVIQVDPPTSHFWQGCVGKVNKYKIYKNRSEKQKAGPSNPTPPKSNDPHLGGGDPGQLHVHVQASTHL
jgi:hypothetical protein